jgi:2-amino-4-hydroxy-6-hydroxymethyldihydropteridine diphosphokinase
MIVIALGANLSSQVGAPAMTLRAALARLPLIGVEVVKISSFYRTPAWPDPREAEFTNAVTIVRTALEAPDLMKRLQELEQSFGRTRGPRNAPRPLDLDVIDYDGRISGGPPVLPHPRLESRGFVLIPLGDIAPQWRHPVSGRTVGELIAALPPEMRHPQRLE